MSEHQYTIFAYYPKYDCTEEVDVVASSEAEARTKAEAELTEGYEPGWEIKHITQNPDGYILY